KPAASYLSEITFRRGIALFVLALAILVGGTWITITLTTNHLVHQDARDNALDWAHSLAAHVTDIEQIASGEQPSTQSIAFFNTARSIGHVFRYVIYNRQGYSQLVSDANGVSLDDISTRTSQAVQAIQSGGPVVTAQYVARPAGLLRRGLRAGRSRRQN